MPNQFDEPECDSEYPEYSEGNGTGLFSRPGDSPDQVSPLPSDSPSPGITPRARRALIGIGIVLVLVLLSILIRQCSSGGTSVDPSPGSSESPAAVPSPGVTPASADPATFEEAAVQFDVFTVQGNGIRTFPLPAGITNGVIDITYTGSNALRVTTNDQSGRYHEGIVFVATTTGAFTATSIFGAYDHDGDYPAAIEVQANGDWQLTFRPLTTLEELPDSYSQDGELPAVFYYTGPGDEIEIVFEEDSDETPNFTVNQETLVDFPERIAAAERTGTITATLIPGPNIVVIDPSGASSWSITKK